MSPAFLKLRARPIAVLGCLWLCVGASAAEITFATYPDGTQVPSANVSTGIFSPTSVVGDQFAALGIHFNNTGLLLELTAFPDGASTSPDGWCPFGGFTCSPNNIVVENSTGGQSLDTLTMTFDIPQTAVQFDVDNGYLGDSTQTTVRLSGGTLATPLTLNLTASSETAACPVSQSQFQLCGRFQLSAAGQTFTEIDILPTTIFGAPAACSGTSGDFNCGGSLVDNISFTATPVATPEPSSLPFLAIGVAGMLLCYRGRKPKRQLPNLPY